MGSAKAYKASILKYLFVPVMLFSYAASSAQIPTGFRDTFPYTIRNVVDVPLVALTIAGSTTNLLFTKDNFFHFRMAAALDAEDLPGLDAQYVPVENRNLHYAHLTGDLIALGSCALALTPVAMLAPDYRLVFMSAFMFAEGAFLTATITTNLKNATDRPRPYVYSDAYTKRERTTDDAWKSFPSSHVAQTAYYCFFAAAFSDKVFLSDDKPWHRIALWTGAAAIPVVAGCMRVAAGEHFPTDVLAGYGLGAGLGLLIPFLHWNKSDYTLIPVSMNGISALQFVYRL